MAMGSRGSMLANATLAANANGKPRTQPPDLFGQRFWFGKNGGTGDGASSWKAFVCAHHVEDALMDSHAADLPALCANHAYLHGVPSCVSCRWAPLAAVAPLGAATPGG